MQSRTTLADRYRAADSPPDSAIHEGLSQILQHCREMAPVCDFEVEIEALLPPVAERTAWLTPALLRLEWNRLHNPNGAGWLPFFGPLISRMLQSDQDHDEEQLILLCRHADFLSQHHCGQVLAAISGTAWRLFQAGMFTPTAGWALRELVADWPFTDQPSALWRIQWTLLRAGEEPAFGGLPWAIAVACDLGALSDESRQRWWALLDANPHNPLVQADTRARQLLAALPKGEFERRLDAWTRLLSEQVKPDLRCGGITLLNWLLQLAETQPGARLDKSLYRIAQADWSCGYTPREAAESGPSGWLAVFLRVLASRPGAGAFACAEALSLHPATAACVGVQRLYEEMLEQHPRT